METQTLLMILVAFHVLPGVFWVGSTFVLARAGGVGAESLTKSQLIAAGLVIVTGLALWSQTHPATAGFGPSEKVLATGAISALTAMLIQSIIVLPSVRTLASGAITAQGPRMRIAIAERVAAALLAITVVCMVTAQYV